MQIRVEWRHLGDVAVVESGILWSDPEIGIEWPLKEVTVSEKDRKAQTLAQWLTSPQSHNFQYFSTLEPQISTRS